MMEKDYSTDTCNEVVEILSHIPKGLYDKLPKDIINYFYQNSDESIRHFKYNVASPISSQNINQETRGIIKFFFAVFWR